MNNIFEQKGFRPGQKIKYRGSIFLIESCWAERKKQNGFIERAPGLECGRMTPSGPLTITIPEIWISEIEKIK